MVFDLGCRIDLSVAQGLLSVFGPGVGHPILQRQRSGESICASRGNPRRPRHPCAKTVLRERASLHCEQGNAQGRHFYMESPHPRPRSSILAASRGSEEWNQNLVALLPGPQPDPLPSISIPSPPEDLAEGITTRQAFPEMHVRAEPRYPGRH